MLMLALPTPDQINAYAVALAALTLAVGGLGVAIVTAIVKFVPVLRELRDTFHQVKTATDTNTAVTVQNTADRSIKTAASMEAINRVAAAVGAPQVDVPPTPDLGVIVPPSS